MPTPSIQPRGDRRLTLFFLYERVHAAAYERFLQEQPGERTESVVIALSVDTEAELSKRNIPFVSGRTYKQTAPDLLTAQDEMMQSFFADPRWGTFVYRGVDLPTTFRFMFRSYLQSVWYYGNLLVSVVEKHPEARRIVVFAPSGIVSSAAGMFARREREAVVDCARTVAAHAGLEIKIIPPVSVTARLRDRLMLSLFSMRRALFGLSLSIWNGVIAALCRPSHPRLLISDHWRNVGPAIELLGQGECMFLDRLEIRHIPWRMLLRYRMRFVHSGDFLSWRMRRHAHERAQEYAREWRAMRFAIAPTLSVRGYSFDELLLAAVDDFVAGFEKLLCEIEGTYALYERLKPDLVILRASVSAQTHFSVLPLVAKQLSIPSLELQHGLEYLGPGSWSREHVAEHVASYGSLVKEELVSAGHASERVHEIGSPRFDNLSRIPSVEGDDTHPLTVLCISPDIRIFEIYDSYSAEDYFTAVMAAIEALGNARTIIKFRPGSPDEDPLRVIAARVFSRVPYVAASSEPLSGLFDQADIVVSCYSTAILEALQRGMPVIIPAVSPVDAAVTEFHFSRYRDAGVLHIAPTVAELATVLLRFAEYPVLRSEMRDRINAFLAQNFSFDGESSHRFAELIIELSEKRRTGDWY